MSLISVIVPVYNVENLLSRCIESVLNQIDQEFELLLIDDGSSDESGSVCDAYAQKDNRIRVFHQENRGASAARNFGIEKAIGQYICFIDSDDCVEPEYLEQLRLGIQNCPDLSVCGVKDCDGENNVKRCSKKYEDFTLKIVPQNAKVFSELMLDDRFSYSVAKIFNASIIYDNHLHFDESMSKSEDTKFVYEYLTHVRECYIIGGSYYRYIHREFGTSLSTRLRVDSLQISTFFYVFKQKCLKEMGIYNEETEHAIQKEQIIASQWNIEAYRTAKQFSLVKKIKLISRILKDPIIRSIAQKNSDPEYRSYYIFQYHSAIILLFSCKWKKVKYKIKVRILAGIKKIQKMLRIIRQ